MRYMQTPVHFNEHKPVNKDISSLHTFAGPLACMTSRQALPQKAWLLRRGLLGLVPMSFTCCCTRTSVFVNLPPCHGFTCKLRPSKGPSLSKIQLFYRLWAVHGRNMLDQNWVRCILYDNRGCPRCAVFGWVLVLSDQLTAHIQAGRHAICGTEHRGIQSRCRHKLQMPKKMAAQSKTGRN